MLRLRILPLKHEWSKSAEAMSLPPCIMHVFHTSLCLVSGCPVEFEVLTAVVVKRYVSSDMTTCSPLNVNRRLDETSGPKIFQTRVQHEAGNTLCGFLVWFVLRPWRWRRHIPLQYQLWRYVSHERINLEVSWVRFTMVLLTLTRQTPGQYLDMYSYHNRPLPHAS
jgi:hypothetical protein